VATGPDEKYHYTAENAKTYDTFEIAGTTYEIGFGRVAELLGDLTGQEFLDFGSGTGRSAVFLKGLGARHIYAVDRDDEMIRVAQAKHLEGITFVSTSHGSIPLDNESVDGAVSLNVFVEIRSAHELREVCREIARTLRPGSQFIVMSTSPMGFGHSFRSYSYPSTQNLRSGALNPCYVNAPTGQFVIEDTYWSEDDYVDALRQTGLSVASIDYPRPAIPSEWSTDEATVPPYIVIKAIKK
jgi:ubiquinone/menaquinone biosynthesis C-methylase UbiE